MFTVTDVSHSLWWCVVELKAEADLSHTAQRLGFGRPWVNSSPRAPVLETRVLRVRSGERFTIYARKKDGFWIGELVPLHRVADKRPFSRRWQNVETT